MSTTAAQNRTRQRLKAAAAVGSMASPRIASLRKRSRPTDAAACSADDPEVREVAGQTEVVEQDAGNVASARAASSRKRARPVSAASPPEAAGEREAPAGAGRNRSARNKNAHPSCALKGSESEQNGDHSNEEEPAEDEEEEVEVMEDDEEKDAAAQDRFSPKRKVVPRSKEADGEDWCFLGDPIPEEEARRRWPERYQKKNGGGRGSVSASSNNGNGDDMKARRHYLQAKVDGCVYSLYDDAYVKAAEGEDDYIGRIVEFFEGTDQQLYMTAQWFFRAKDTVIKDHAAIHVDRRVFLSEEKNDNVLDCIVSKIKIVKVTPNIDLEVKEESIPNCDLYYDMSYSLAYSTFANLPPENGRSGSEASSTISSEDVPNFSNVKSLCNHEASSTDKKAELSLLDLYSGCGAMSTGLCLGANLTGLNLETRWAVDINRHACESLKLNHPHTEVRNEKAEDFLALIREWEKMCQKYSLLGTENSLGHEIESNNSDDDGELEDTTLVPKGEFEVGKLVGICFGDPHNIGKVGLKFKIRWKGYGPSEDTWEPIDGLSKCNEKIENFVRSGFKKKILPLPGNVDAICGGPPCQGISGFNRFRNKNAPLEDPKNQQMVVFMDIVEFLKPKYVLMENVVDILKFAQGFLGRYALSRLVAMNYQARLGILAAGCFGLPQFRMRCFLWGAQPTEKLPQFPLPTHDVVVRGGAPTEFEQSIVAYNENQQPQLEKALLLGDAISDLPPVANDESREEMPYGRPPRTEFQRFIRLTRQELLDNSTTGDKLMPKGKLFDHMPLQLNEDDYQRVCQIPKRKGACFRDLPGVVVGPDNVVEWDPNIPRVLLSSGKPLVPDYAMSFIKGKSSKPFARLWWDETVPTVVTRAEPHNQAILHPDQDRVLTIRENSRLQGFPDYYKLCGPVKERYIQVGNAVAVPVSRALGYGFGLAFQGDGADQPVFTLPPRFPLRHVARQSPVSSES